MMRMVTGCMANGGGLHAVWVSCFRKPRAGGSLASAVLVPLVAVALAAVCVTELRAADVPGDDPLAVRDAIGTGIHAFYEGDFARAHDELTSAVEAGATDARAYYFRGLAALKLGRTSEAEADFAQGAEREAADGSVLRVSRALERVQGCDRLTLEKHRSRARLVSLQRDREAVGRRYSQIEDATSDVLRRRRPEDIRPELVDPRGRRGAGGAEEVPQPRPARGRKPVDADDPFADEKPMTEDEAADRDMQEEEMAAEDEDEAANRDMQNEVEAASGN
jgi:hypothetical protein